MKRDRKSRVSASDREPDLGFVVADRQNSRHHRAQCLVRAMNLQKRTTATSWTPRTTQVQLFDCHESNLGVDLAKQLGQNVLRTGR